MSRKDSAVFRCVAIVNRGEAAMRLIRAVREIVAETATAIETVALYTDVDRTATFVREADRAYCLGPAAARPYLDLRVLERALVETGADAAWVGWGFVAEDPAFEELCERLGVTFIGPSSEAMRKLGDKIGAKRIAEEVGVPVAPWSRGPVESLDAALAAAAKIGYPLMLKAAAGGGGRGIRVIRDESELVNAFERTRQEAARAFGIDVMFLERLITGARHVEVQVIADGQGTAWALGVRDCSVQRRNQKVIEESASPVLSPEQAANLKAAAERLIVAVGYRGAATVEFLYHPGDKQVTFLEVNTRLQVEHPITEATTGFDLVKAQLHVASAGRLQGVRPVERGHAVEARLNAEDPDRDFMPCPGHITRLELPAGPGIRVDTGFSEGDTIPADFDSMIVKIIAYGRDRDGALGRLRRAIQETKVIIKGGVTNKSFLLDLLNRPELIDASADTGWIDRVGDGLVSHRHSAVALVAAAIDAYEEKEHVERQRLLLTAFGGRPQVQHDSARPLDLKLRDVGYRARVARRGPCRFHVSLEAGAEVRTADVKIDRFDRHTGQIVVNGARYRLLADIHGPVHLIEVDGVTHRVSRDEGDVVRSPMPAMVIATPLEVGAEIEAGAQILVLESMKMETVLQAPFKARVREYFVSVGSQVEAGAPLLRLEPIAGAEVEDSPAAAAAGLDLPTAPEEVPARERTARGLEDLRALLLGFDLHDERQVLHDYLAARRAATEEGHQPLAKELEIIEIFADLAELSRNRPARMDVGDEGHLRNPHEHFHTYLRSLDVERAGLPEAFQAKLAKALGHYDVTDLKRSPELEAAVFRIFLARQPATAKVAAKVVAALLESWRWEPPPDKSVHKPVRLALERLVAATKGHFPVVADLALDVMFAWFQHQQLLRRAQERIRIFEHLLHLDAYPDAPDRTERIAEMVRSTEPLVPLLGQRLLRGDRDNTVILEVLTRRYYGNKDLTHIRATEYAGYRFWVAERAGSRLVSCAVGFDALDAALGGLAELAGGERSVDADIYLSWENQPADSDVMAAALGEAASAHPLPPQVRRLTITITPEAAAR
nr:biotin carboxylase N-terminal domain-containing protein [Frankia casuarinae]